MPNVSPDSEFPYEIKEQDTCLPIANIDRVMRNALPSKAKISKEARECMQECVSEFIAFITSQGAEKCAVEKRKTLNGEDILYSLHSLGFENYAELLRIYLVKYRIYELDEVEKRRIKYLARKEKMLKQKKVSENIEDGNSPAIKQEEVTNLMESSAIPDPNLMSYMGSSESNIIDDEKIKLEIDNPDIKLNHTIDTAFDNVPGMFWDFQQSDSSNKSDEIDTIECT